MKEFLDPSTRVQDELWEIQKTHNAVAPFLPHRTEEEVEEEHGGYDLSWWDRDKKESTWCPPEKEERVFQKSLQIPDNLSSRIKQQHLRFLKEVTDLLLGKKDLSLKAMSVLDVATVPEALDWFERFCLENEIKEDVVGLNGLIDSKFLWWQIKNQMSLKEKI